MSEPDAFYESVGRQMKAARLARGLTLRDVSQHLGINESAYWKWESARQRPPVNRIVQIAALLRTPVIFLLTGQYAESPQNASVFEMLSPSDRQILEDVAHAMIARYDAAEAE